METDLQTLAALAIRHLLTATGGALATDGYLGSSTKEQFAAAGMLLVGVAWSWWQKEGQAEAAAKLAELQVIVAARRQQTADVTAKMAVK